MGLHNIHSKFIMHRDIKPDNILLKKQTSHQGFIAKYADFGVCVVGTSYQDLDSDLAGTPYYIAPEILR